jgi:hypothetical protein
VNRKPCYKFEIPGNVAGGCFEYGRSSSSNVYVEGFHLLKIKLIEDSDYNDDVYNLEVDEDHSMTCRTGCVKNCEGMGMPQVEAAACGIPIMAINYSAMEDVVKILRGTPLKVKTMFRELETHAYRALPDNEYCAEQIWQFMNLPRSIRAKKGNDARKCAEKYCNWDITAKKWENYLDQVSLTELQGQWDTAPPRMYVPPEQAPGDLNNTEFVNWLMIKVLNEPERINSLFALRMIQDLHYGARIDGPSKQMVDRQKVFDLCKHIVNNKNLCEEARCGMRQLTQEDFIDYAHLKDKLRSPK